MSGNMLSYSTIILYEYVSEIFYWELIPQVDKLLLRHIIRLCVQFTNRMALVHAHNNQEDKDYFSSRSNGIVYFFAKSIQFVNIYLPFLNTYILKAKLKKKNENFVTSCIKKSIL